MFNVFGRRAPEAPIDQTLRFVVGSGVRRRVGRSRTRSKKAPRTPHEKKIKFFRGRGAAVHPVKKGAKLVQRRTFVDDERGSRPGLSFMKIITILRVS